MSLKCVEHTTTTQSFRTGAVTEMQREDFLQLAAALRQFNVYESMAMVNTRHESEGHAHQANEQVA